MKVTTKDGKLFELVIESNTDREFVDAIDIQGCNPQRMSFMRSAMTPQGSKNISVALLVDRTSQANLRAQSGSESLNALGQLFSLGLSHAAFHGGVGSATANPKPQEQLPALLKQLQGMIDALSGVVGQQELVVKEVSGAHGFPKLDETAIVAQGGAA